MSEGIKVNVLVKKAARVEDDYTITEEELIAIKSYTLPVGVELFEKIYSSYEEKVEEVSWEWEKYRTGDKEFSIHSYNYSDLNEFMKLFDNLAVITDNN